MITGISKTESTYRAVNLDSSSSLKDFCLDRKKYFRKYIMNEDVEDKDTQAAMMGRVVETLLMESELFDERFYMSACAGAPTGLMLEFVEALYKYTKAATNDEGVVTRSFEDISKDAYVESGFKIKYEAVIGKFVGSDAEIYYNEICTVRANNLSVVTVQDVTNAERIVEELKNNPITRDIVTLVDSANYKVLNQLQVEDYEVDGHRFKSMMDKVIVDYKKKTVQVYDLKCVWAVENFFEEYYLYRRAYIQAYLYWKAAIKLTEPGSPIGATGYEVLPPRFMVCDSTNYFSPLIYTLTLDDINNAYYGFEYKGRKYTGVKTLIQDLQWALDNNTWNISRENSLNNGIVNLTEQWKKGITD